MHLKYLGVTTVELICFAGKKFFRVRSLLGSFEFYWFVVVFGEMSFSRSIGFPF